VASAGRCTANWLSISRLRGDLAVSDLPEARFWTATDSADPLDNFSAALAMNRSPALGAAIRKKLTLWRCITPNDKPLGE
jgi:hypothetical protein